MWVSEVVSDATASRAFPPGNSLRVLTLEKRGRLKEAAETLPLLV
jgi:hypothetical protein